jgi:hypothetical protein
MKNHSFTKYYRVFQHDTTVTEISVNDFKTSFVCSHVSSFLAGEDSPIFSLPTDGSMFYGYLSKIKAMEMAKAGALSYMNRIIKQVQDGIDLLTNYRSDHYEDLNVGLLEANIRRLEQQMHIK